MVKSKEPARKRLIIKHSIREFKSNFKTLQGNPHYIALGMAFGVFISITPTMPFHTPLAIALSFVFCGSKSAAAIGVWFCNPLTMPFFYLASYEAGTMLFGISSSFDIKHQSISELLNMSLGVACAMVAGGVLLGLIPGIAAYFITHKAVTKFRSQDSTRQYDNSENQN